MRWMTGFLLGKKFPCELEVKQEGRNPILHSDRGSTTGRRSRANGLRSGTGLAYLDTLIMILSLVGRVYANRCPPSDDLRLTIGKPSGWVDADLPVQPGEP